jgi:hypothetical protein
MTRPAFAVVQRCRTGQFCAVGSEAGGAGLGDRDGDVFGAGDGAGFEVDGEVVEGVAAREPLAAAAGA